MTSLELKPKLKVEAHMTFLELKSDLAWNKAQVQDLRFTSLCLNWSPSSTLEAFMTLLDSRTKSNIWDPNDFKLIQNPSPMLGTHPFILKKKGPSSKFETHMAIFLNEILSPTLEFHMILFELKPEVHCFQLLWFWT